MPLTTVKQLNNSVVAAFTQARELATSGDAQAGAGRAQQLLLRTKVAVELAKRDLVSGAMAMSSSGYIDLDGTDGAARRSIENFVEGIGSKADEAAARLDCQHGLTSLAGEIGLALADIHLAYRGNPPVDATFAGALASRGGQWHFPTRHR